MGGADLTVSTLDDPKALVICYVYTRTFVDGTLDEYSYSDGAERRLKQDIFVPCPSRAIFFVVRQGILPRATLITTVM